MQKIKRYGMIFLIGLIFGIFGNNYYKTPKETKVVKTQDNSTTKEKIITKILKKPNNEIIKTVIEYRNISKQKNKVYKMSKSQIKDWEFGLSSSLIKRPVYTIHINRRILGDVYLGLYGRTDKEIGVNLTILF